MGPVYRWIHRVWYEGAALGWILLPLSGLYRLITAARQYLYRRGVLRTYRASVPVIVVGNIAAGGTGKTPVVIWLAGELRSRNFSPGIVSRGYGGSKADSPMRVDVNSPAHIVGDEPVLLARRSACPVVVDSNRVRAAAMLADDNVDIIIADDGLQHYRLFRDYEICVIDGARGLGNRRLLPAGPLRESPERLAQVDQVLLNGALTNRKSLGEVDNVAEFELAAIEACRLNGSLNKPLEAFVGTTVHGVAGIGNPARFFDLLRTAGIQVIEHAFPDHASLVMKDLEFGDNFVVLMTEKDAVKLDTVVDDRFWYVPVAVRMDPALALATIGQMESRLRGRQESS